MRVGHAQRSVWPNGPRASRHGATDYRRGPVPNRFWPVAQGNRPPIIAAPIGYLAVAEIPVAINRGFIAMRPKPRVANLFLLHWARGVHAEIVSRANGSTFMEISKASFRPIPVLTPSSELMRAFEHQARPLYERIVANELESRALAALRDALLPRLMSGELRVTGL